MEYKKNCTASHKESSFLLRSDFALSYGALDWIGVRSFATQQQQQQQQQPSAKLAYGFQHNNSRGWLGCVARLAPAGMACNCNSVSGRLEAV